MVTNRKIINRLLIALSSLIAGVLTSYVIINLEFVRPNMVEGITLLLCPLLVLVGIALIRRHNRPSHWDAPAHRRAMKAQEQKNREGLPPGQL